jgi:fructose-bisphosphate aldolase class II
MLFNMKYVLSKAKEHKFAVPAFNISSYEMFDAVIKTAVKEDSPVIIEIHPDELSYLGPDIIFSMKKVMSEVNIPTVLHLDHGGSVNDVMHAVNCGFTSVMVDGSLLSYEENVKLATQVSNLVHGLDISVEAELGTIGKLEDSQEGGSDSIEYTNPDLAVDFVKTTGVDSLAVAIGTSHGLYPKDKIPKLNIELLKVLNARLSIPLVLHGGSGNKDEEVKESVNYGVCKVNISSDIKSAFFKGVKEVFETSPSAYEPNVIFPIAKKRVSEVVEHKMKLFGSIKKAEFYK